MNGDVEMNGIDIELIVNNTGCDTSAYDREIGNAIRASGGCAFDFYEMFHVSPIAGYPGRWRLEWVDPRRPCDCCGSKLAGQRHEFAILGDS